MIQYNIFVADGIITHCDMRDENSNLLPLDIAELETAIPSLNAGLIASLAAKDDELAAVKAAFAEKQAYQDAMVEKVSAVIASKDPAQYEQLAQEFLTPAQELAKAEIAAQIAALQDKLESLTAQA